MNSRFLLVVAVLSLILAISPEPSAAVTVTLLNDPIADGIFTEDGVTGYQYFYDVTFDFGGEINFVQADAQVHLGGTIGPAGPAGAFNGTESAYYREAATDASRFGVWQVWYHSSVGQSCSLFGCNTDKDFNYPAAIGDVGGTVWDTNVVDTNGDFGPVGAPLPWALANPFHDPADYPQDTALMDPGGSLSPTLGLAWRNLSSVVQGNGWIPVLSMTVRIVHPNSPGSMNYYLTMDAFGFPNGGVVTGPTGPPVEVNTCVIGDADCDGDVDIGGDILPAFTNFTGPGSFGKTRLEGDVQGSVTGATTDPNGHDSDVDVSDLLTMFGAFTGPLDEAGGLGAPAAAGDPAIPDLIYDPATGEVILDPDGSSIIGYSLQNATNGFLPGAHTPILAGVTTALPSQLEEAALAAGSGSLGPVFPTGLDLAGLQSLLTVNQVSRSLGTPLVPFDLVVLGGSPAVPEPTSLVLWLCGSIGVGLLTRWRRRLSLAG